MSTDDYGLFTHPLDPGVFLGPPGVIAPAGWSGGHEVVLDHTPEWYGFTCHVLGRNDDRLAIYGDGMTFSSAGPGPIVVHVDRVRLVIRDDLTPAARALAHLLGEEQHPNAPHFHRDPFDIWKDREVARKTHGFLFQSEHSAVEEYLICEREHWNLDSTLEEQLAVELWQREHGWSDDDERWRSWEPTADYLERAYEVALGQPVGTGGYIVLPGIKGITNLAQGIAFTLDRIHQRLMNGATIATEEERNT